MHIAHLLSSHSQNALDFALHLYEHQDEIVTATDCNAPVLDLAL